MEHWRTLFKPPRFLPLVPLQKPWDPEFGYFSQPQPNLDLPTRIEQWDAQVWAELSVVDLLGEHQPRIFNVISTLCSTFGYWDVEQTPFLRDLIQAWWSSPITTGCYFGWWRHSIKYLSRKHRRVVKARVPPRGPHQIHQELYLRGLEVQVQVWEKAYSLRLHREKSFRDITYYTWWNNRPERVFALRRTLELLKERGRVGTFLEHLRRSNLTHAEEEILNGRMCLLADTGLVTPIRLEVFPVAPCLVDRLWEPLLLERKGGGR